MAERYGIADPVEPRAYPPTGYNPELSDRSFLDKRNHQEGGFRATPLRLNQGLGSWSARSNTSSTNPPEASKPPTPIKALGSRAKGTVRLDSDVDLLITVPDPWLNTHDRVRVLGALWRQSSSHRLPLDLLLYSQSEVSQRQQYRGAVTTRADEEGILLAGQWPELHEEGQKVEQCA